MSKMSELSVLISELHDTASALNAIADGLHDLFSTDAIEPENTAEAPSAPSSPPVPDKLLALEDVRAVLAKKSSEGNGAKVQELIRAYGVTKLSQIDPSHYPDLLRAVEVM